MAAGRPLKFKDVEELQKKIDDYFENTPKEEWMITGLALALDTSRETLMNYEEKSEFFDAIKRAKLMVESAYESRMIKRGNAGDIFGLKNMGWTDRQEIDTKITGSLSLGKAFEALKQASKNDK